MVPRSPVTPRPFPVVRFRYGQFPSYLFYLVAIESYDSISSSFHSFNETKICLSKVCFEVQITKDG